MKKKKKTKKSPDEAEGGGDEKRLEKVKEWATVNGFHKVKKKGSEWGTKKLGRRP